MCDYIEWNDFEGTVRSTTLRVTRVQTPNGELVTVPNAVLTGQAVVRPFGRGNYRVVEQIGLTYDDVCEAIRHLETAAKSIVRVHYLIEDPERREVFVIPSAYATEIERRRWVPSVFIPPADDALPMSASFDFGDSVALVTGASGALGSAVCEAFADAGATVAAADVRAPDDEDAQLDPGRERIHFYEGDFTDEESVEQVVSQVVDDHGRLDYLANIAGTWRGGTPIAETDADEFDFLFDVNLKTTFLASKHALPHLRGRAGESDDGEQGAIVSVSARSSLEGGEGDGPYRASKAGVRLLTESIAEEEKGEVRANAVMPSVIDTPANREMMPDSDHDTWVDPADIAETILVLCSDATSVTSGAAVPVYGEA